MAVKLQTVDSECKVYIVVTAASIETKADLISIMDDLDTALTHLDAKIPDDELFYYQICIQVDGIGPTLGRYESQGMGDTHDPWTSFCPAFWNKAAETPELRDRIDAFLTRFVGILSERSKTAVSALSEGDETQLGEPLMAHLALTDVRFIPMYRNFLAFWDMHHEVEISGAIDQILKTHGWCAETEGLLSQCLLDPWSFDATAMFIKTFAKINKQMTDSTLFKRYIVTLYRWHLQTAAEACRMHQSRLNSGDADFDQSMTRMMIYQPAFETGTKAGRAEAAIVGGLQALQLGTDAPKPSTWRDRVSGLFGR